MKAQGGADVQLYSILTLAQDGGEQPASGPGRFTAKSGPDTHLIGGCVVLRASLVNVYDL